MELEKVVLLKKMPAFENVTETALMDFVSLCNEETYAKSKVIIKHGKRNDNLYILQYGKVYLENKGKKVATFEAGDMFGEISGLCPMDVSFDAVVAEEAVLLKISHQNLLEVMTLHPSIMDGLIKILAIRLKQLDNKHI